MGHSSRGLVRDTGVSALLCGSLKEKDLTRPRKTLFLGELVAVAAVFGATALDFAADLGARVWLAVGLWTAVAAVVFVGGRLQSPGFAFGSVRDLRNIAEAMALLGVLSALLYQFVPPVGPWPLWHLVEAAALALLAVGLWRLFLGLVPAQRASRQASACLPGQMPAVTPAVMPDLHRGRIACLLSFTRATDEPRLHRQCRLLTEAGWQVIVVGYPGRSDRPEAWSLLTVTNHGSRLTPIEHRILRALLFVCRWLPSMAELYYWWSSGYLGIWKQVTEGLGEGLGSTHASALDLVVANDYFTAPMAYRLAQRSNCPFVVDCHEHATSQFADRRSWRLLERHWVAALEKRYLPRAAAVSTVCDGIADLLYRDYGLAQRPVVVRSVPSYQQLPFRSVSETVEVLYHGLLTSNRGLESAIASVQNWPSEYRLRLRGYGPDSYVQHLRQLAESLGVGRRVIFAEPVLLSELIAAASRSDIGLFVTEAQYPQRVFTLPNKFFEYVMAGLALCVSNLPEMGKIVAAHDLGVLVPRADPQSLAEAIQGLTRERIEACKRRALVAAKTLCWEREAEGLRQAYQTALAGGLGQRDQDSYLRS